MKKKLYLPHNPRTVALICMGPSVLDYLSATLTQELALTFADEVWALNMSANTFHHDVVFWMDDLQSQASFRSGLIDLLRKRGKPVITCTRYPELVPSSYDYPIEEVAAMAIPVWGKPYLNNGVAMAIAYALHIGVRCMKIYGADFSYPNRDFAESGRACVESWITLASMRGMEIQLCPNTSLLDQVKDDGIYGFAEQPEIKLPNGETFKYVRAEGDKVGKFRGGNVVALYTATGYVAEDSSRGSHVNVPADVSRGEGPGPDHAGPAAAQHAARDPAKAAAF